VKDESENIFKSADMIITKALKNVGHFHQNLIRSLGLTISNPLYRNTPDTHFP